MGLTPGVTLGLYWETGSHNPLPCVSPLPLNVSQLPIWSPDTPHPLPWVQSSFLGAVQPFGSLNLERVMSPSVITHLPGN